MVPPADNPSRGGPMMALGLIETIGAVGGIEAADAACKAANVRLIGKEYADAGLHLIKILGEVAAVRAAVDAGAAAAKRCGQLAGTHVIPRPDMQLEQWIFAKHNDPKALAFTRAPQVGVHHAGGNPGPVTTLPAGYEELPVRELRGLARDLEGLGLQGRDISSANRDQLLEAIRAWAKDRK